jgi:hypothetical protein
MAKYFEPKGSSSELHLPTRYLILANSRMGRGEVLKIFVGKPEGKRPLGQTRRRWEDNINIYI